MLSDLFWGTGTAHSILLFAFVIASGLLLGRVRIKGVSIGSTWILFLGILLSHFGFRSDPTVLSFMKDFGLILFVFSIGLQVGPGFFQSFRSGGVKLNLLAVLIIALAVVVAVGVHFIFKEDLKTMVGVMSGAVTNTPGLGAAQSTMTEMMKVAGESEDVIASSSSLLASAYAVAYPMGVLGVILVLIVLKSLFKVNLKQEQKQSAEEGSNGGTKARRMHCEVRNPAIVGKAIREVVDEELSHKMVISRVMRGDDIFIPVSDTVLEDGDKLLIVTSQQHVDSIRIVFGAEIPLHLEDWVNMDDHLVSRKLVVTKSKINGKTIQSLNVRAIYGVQITRVQRAGLELPAQPDLRLQMGDTVHVVGTKEAIQEFSPVVGNNPEQLSHPNLVPIFFGIALGVIFGSIPMAFPGIPQPIKLGLAGGPLIIAILLGYFGPQWKITTYTTLSANMMIREVGISFFLAAVGLGAGESFVAALTEGGYWWILFGTLITIVPIFLVALLARYAFKLNFYQICGLICGATTSPAGLAFAQDAYGTNYTSINYATVYPLSMFLRVLAAQLLMVFALA
jgi:putative transport protein